MNARKELLPAAGLLAGLLVVCSIVWSALLLYSQNTLYTNGRWIVGKRMMQVGVTGGDEFLIMRAPLARNRLDLSFWNGFEEIFSREDFLPTRIEFSFQIPQGSYLDLTHGRSNGTLRGLRLSRREGMPSFAYEGTTQGAFLSTSALSIAGLDEGNHHASLFIQGSGLRLRIDGKEEVRAPGVFQPGRVGFRSAMRGALVLGMSIRTASGRAFREDFSNVRGAPRAFCLTLAGFLALILLGPAGMRRRSLPPRAALVRSCAFLLAAAALGALLYAFDFFYWSGRPSEILMRTVASEHRPLPRERFESLRRRIFSSWARLSGMEQPSPGGGAEQGYPPDRIWEGPMYCGPDRGAACAKIRYEELETRIFPRKACRRMMFIGTSQTIGAGAELLEHSFFARTHRALRSALGAPLESLNIAVSASNAGRLAWAYSELYRPFRPDLAVINLSNNDSDEDFGRSMEELLRMVRAQGVKVVLLEEANSSEQEEPSSLRVNHSTLRELGRRFAVPVYPLHDFLLSARVDSSGALWWDAMHLTSYGQEVVAGWLSPKLLKELR